jgi:hypothetical protein
MPILLLTDAAVRDPQRDYLKFSRYVDPIVDILTAPAIETPLTIGIFGTWGSGKSTVLELTDRRLADEHADEFVRVHFNAWLHRKEPNILIPLLHALHETLEQDPLARFAESARKIGTVFLRLAANLVLKSVTIDKVSVENLEALEKQYAAEKGRVESEMRKLHSTLQKEADTIENNGARLVFFIDDLDRCEPDQMIELLDSMKLFLDLRNAFFIIAADKEVIDRGVEVRYSKFSFGDAQRASAIGSEYLEKMVQVPFNLLPLYSNDIEKYVEGIAPRIPPERRELLAAVAVRNPRKIKRIVNAYWMLDAIARPDLNRDVLLRLIVLQIQHGDVYWQSSLEPRLLTALEGAYANKFDVESIGSYAAYGPDLRERVQKFCIKNHDGTSDLRRLFEGEPFTAIGPALRDHFAAVGT